MVTSLWTFNGNVTTNRRQKVKSVLVRMAEGVGRQARGPKLGVQGRAHPSQWYTTHEKLLGMISLQTVQAGDGNED